MITSENKHWLEKVYHASNHQELEASYDGWAEQYDHDVMSWGYLIPAVLAALVGRYVPPAKGGILDAGAGTGILGEVLSLAGYQDLTAIDLSEGMLEVAGRKDVYRSLRRMVMGERLDFPNRIFAAVISGGVFTQGHAPPHALDELLRVTMPGGYIVFSARTDVYLNDGLSMHLNHLEQQERWRLIEKTHSFHSLPVGEPQVTGQVFVYQVN